MGVPFSPHPLSPFVYWYRHLGCFCILATMNTAAMNIGMHISFLISGVFKYISRNKIAASYANFISNFFFFCETSILFSTVTVPIYISTNSILRVPFTSHSCEYLLLVFLMVIILTGMRWSLIVVLIYIFLVISDVEQSFLFLLVICTSSLEKCPFRSLLTF